MKTIKYVITGFILSCLAGQLLNAQSGFDLLEYKQFLKNNKTLTAEQLLDQHPPKTVYYSSRTNPGDLDGVPWFDSINRVYQLSGEEEELLANNYFMVSERLNSYSWADAFIKIYSNDLPLFISTDFVLHSLHESYDEILKTLEWQFLEPNLGELLAALWESYPALYDKYSGDTRMLEALSDVDLYVSVARSLLSGSEYLPKKNDNTLYNTVMKAIESEDMTEIPLFTTSPRMRTIDFSQFKPRSHYTEEFWDGLETRTLEDYFRAMMWMGRIGFLLTAPPSNPWEPDWTDEELRRMQLGALLLNELLYSCGEAERLQKHEQIITFFVGEADNMTTKQLEELASGMLSSPADLFDEVTFATFMELLNSSDDYGQKIMGNCFYVDPHSVDPGQLPVSFRLMGQKFLLDSYVLSEVVYDRIIYENKKIYRGLPDPLDVMATLGNEDAMALLEEELETYKYAYKVNSIKYLVDSYDEDFWQQSLYNTWLAAIRELNPLATSANLPYFMQTTAWHLEKLNTQLTSWAMLRHDNLLYGKQSYTGMTACSFPYTYIEPYPACYERIQLFAENATEFLGEVLAGTDFRSKSEIVEFYKRYAEIMGIFKEIAEKELAGTALDETEMEFLKTMINSMMVSGPAITGWYNDLFFNWGGLDFDFKVADVHTQPTDEFGTPVGYVLHVGSGRVNNGVFLAPNPVNPAQLMAFTGPVSSFHYEVTNNFYRYNDDEWEENFLWNSTGGPPRPDWVSVYLADDSGGKLPEGRKLKGEVYTGTHADPHASMNEIDYLLAFPNPADELVHLRFILNRSQPVNIEMYDVTGKMVMQQFHGILQPAEHDIDIDLSRQEKGMYLIRFRSGNRIISKEIIKL